MKSRRRIASLSLDLDNHWSYLKVHGDPGWEKFPSYLHVVVPRVLDFLSRNNLRITFFLVGQDAALERNHPPLKMIADAGHELGNHSFSHEPWFHRYHRSRIESEIALAENCIYKVTGIRTVGYRGPGFSVSELALQVLESKGYLYDASSFPTFCGPLARLYYLWRSNLNGRDREERNMLFGPMSEGFRPLRPYRWRHGQDLLEIPVSTMPILRTPIHLSYLLYLAGFSPKIALFYFQTALNLYRAASGSPSVLLHPLDFLGVDDQIGLEFFPAMQLTRRRKLEFVADAIRLYCDHFEVVPIREHANAVLTDVKKSSKPSK